MEAGVILLLRETDGLSQAQLQQALGRRIWISKSDRRLANLEFHAIDVWDELIWQKAEPIYRQSFPEHGRKKRDLIKRMFAKKMCYLHVVVQNDEVIAMALTGRTETELASALLIDYFAVKEAMRGKQVGQRFMAYLKEWASNTAQLDGIIVEVEAEDTETNRSRIRFWEKSGFVLTDYVHSYIWVPEKYRAMYLKLHSDSPLPEDGQQLFSFITSFHKKAYAR